VVWTQSGGHRPRCAGRRESSTLRAPPVRFILRMYMAYLMWRETPLQGVDTDCGGGGTPNWGNTTLLELMTDEATRSLIEPLIDASLTRLFTVRMRLGQFDPPSSQPWGSCE
jgi:hypothetical protein